MYAQNASIIVFKYFKQWVTVDYQNSVQLQYFKKTVNSREFQRYLRRPNCWILYTAMETQLLSHLRDFLVDSCSLLSREEAHASKKLLATLSFLKYVPAHTNRQENLLELYRSLPVTAPKIWLSKKQSLGKCFLMSRGVALAFTI